MSYFGAKSIYSAPLLF